jgi:replicative DNA helicase
VPPHSLEAEVSVLGAALLSRTAASEADELLRAEDFYRNAHRVVFEGIQALLAAGEPIDTVTLTDWLARQDRLDEVGGAAAIHDLTVAVPTAANAAYYARIVRDRALLRRLIEAGTRVARLGYEAAEDATTVVDRAESIVFEVAQIRGGSEYTVLGELLNETYEQIERLAAQNSEVTGLATGYDDLDRLTAGLQPQNLVILAARPAMGKCVVGTTRVVDPSTGRRRRVDDLVRATDGSCELLATDGDQLVRTRPSGRHDNGVQPVVRVRTRSGRTLTATVSHPLLTPEGWRPLASLTPGTPIAVPARLPVEGSLELAPPDLARLAAALIARLRPPATAGGPPPVALEPLPPPAPPPTAGPAARKPSPRTEATARSLGTRTWSGDPPSGLPDAAFTLPAAQLALLLGGVVDDRGSWRFDALGRPTGLDLAADGPPVLSDLQHLLLRLGVVSRVRPMACLLEIRGATNLRRLAAALSAADHSQDGGRAAGDEPDSDRSAGDLCWDPIVAVDPAGTARVYDLTVPGLHNFVADDIVVHNSSLALGVSKFVSVDLRRPAIIFSLEMSRLEIVNRLLSSEARIDSARLRTGRLDDRDWRKLSDALGALSEAPLFIDDTPSISLMEIRAKCRRLKQREGLDLVIVDYLQLMQSHRRADSRTQEVAEISRGLKMLAKELDVPVVALSQLSRQPESRTDKRPQLADLRESGCLTRDTRLFRADTGSPITFGELLDHRLRDVPVWARSSDGELVAGRLTHAFASGRKQVHRVRLRSGLQVTASANHPFLTPVGWRRLDQLWAGTPVAVAARLPEPTEPCAWDPDELRLLAALLGAATGTHRLPVVVACPDAESLDQVAKAAWNRFGVALEHRSGSSDGGEQAELVPAASDRSHPLFAWLDELGLADLAPSELRLPSGVFGLDRDQLWYFVRHLWRAGSGDPEAAAEPAAWDQVGFRTPSEPLAQDLQLLMLRLGLPSRWARDREHPATAFRVTVDTCGLPRPTPGQDLAWDAVQTIEALGSQAVFDATVAEHHTFLAEGVVLHNSIEQDADIVGFIYRDEVYDDQTEDQGIAELIIAKHRNGATGVVKLAFLNHITTFANLARNATGGTAPGGAGGTPTPV